MNPCEIAATDMRCWVTCSFANQENEKDQNRFKTQWFESSNEQVLPLMVIRSNQVQNPWVNYMLVHPCQSYENEDTVAMLLTETDRLVADFFNGCSFSVIVTRSIDDGAANANGKNQFIVEAMKRYKLNQWDSVAMVLPADRIKNMDLERDLETLPQDVAKIVQVKDLETLKAYTTCFMSCWGSTVNEEVMNFYSSSDTSNPNLYRIAAMSQNNEVMGTGALIVNSETGSSFFNDITVPAIHRNKGIGSYITKMLIRESLRRNVQRCTLNASDMGALIYERMGFEKVGTLLYLHKDEH